MAMERAVHFDEDSSVQYGLEEYTLEGGLDILESIRVGRPEVRVLRLVTTPVEGCQLLKRLRNDPQAGDIPIIVLTR